MGGNDNRILWRWSVLRGVVGGSAFPDQTEVVGMNVFFFLQGGCFGVVLASLVLGTCVALGWFDGV